VRAVALSMIETPSPSFARRQPAKLRYLFQRERKGSCLTKP